jgi:hypothetical protein
VSSIGASRQTGGICQVCRICARDPYESAADHIFSFDECITGGLV